MPFAVSQADSEISRHEFYAYVRLLEKRGIDWSNAERVSEPGTSSRAKRMARKHLFTGRGGREVIGGDV